MVYVVVVLDLTPLLLCLLLFRCCHFVFVASFLNAKSGSYASIKELKQGKEIVNQKQTKRGRALKILTWHVRITEDAVICICSVLCYIFFIPFTTAITFFYTHTKNQKRKKRLTTMESFPKIHRNSQVLRFFLLGVWSLPKNQWRMSVKRGPMPSPVIAEHSP